MTETLPLPETLGHTDPIELPVQITPVFEWVPNLQELISFGGTPGIEYRQICTHNLRRAQEEHFTTVPGTFLYQIVGPKGGADCHLMQRGKAIPGATKQSGARICKVDSKVEELTGLWINPHKHVEEPKVEEPKKKPGRPTNAEVAAREAQGA